MKQENLKKVLGSAKRKPQVGNFKGFAEETKQELRKVSWPSQKKVVKTSSIILAIVVVLTVFVAVADLVFVKVFATLRYFG